MTAPPADLAAKALREEEYHLAHAVPLVQRLLQGTDESRRRIAASVERLFPVAKSLFEPTAAPGRSGDASMSNADVLEREWIGAVDAYLRSADLVIDTAAPAKGLGGRRGERSEHFAALHANMTAVLRIDPAAQW